VTFDVDPAREPAASSAVAPALVRWQEKGMPEEELPATLAFFLICTEPTHVPDHWESQSKLALAGRHGLLLLEDASRPVEGQPQFIYAPLPESYRAEAPAGLHKGLVGFALHLGGQEKYHALYFADFKDLEVAPGRATTMRLQVRSPGPRRRTRRGFLMMNPEGLTTKAGWLGDPRLRPTLKILEVTPAPAPREAAPEPAP
jgi:hypothetical protein